MLNPAPMSDPPVDGEALRELLGGQVSTSPATDDSIQRMRARASAQITDFDRASGVDYWIGRSNYWNARLRAAQAEHDVLVDAVRTLADELEAEANHFQDGATQEAAHRLRALLPRNRRELR